MKWGCLGHAQEVDGAPRWGWSEPVRPVGALKALIVHIFCFTSTSTLSFILIMY